MIVTMKKYILAMLLGCLFLASCNETDCSYLNEFKLVESTTNYSAKACSGYILYDGGQGDAVVTATSSEEWCKVSAEASKVYISLDDNTSIDSRTAMVTLKCGNQTKRVPVTQLGRVTELSEETLYSSENTAMSIDYKARNTFGFEITGLPEWVSYTLTEDGIHFDVQANKTGSPRKGTAIIKATNTDIVKSVDFVQFASDDLFGKWIAVYDDMFKKDEKGVYAKDTVEVEVALDKANSKVSITGLCDTELGSFPLVGKLTKDGSYELVGCEVIGSIFGVYNAVQYPITAKGQYLEEDPLTLKCAFDFEGNVPVCTFVDNNGISAYKFVGILVDIVDSKGESAGSLMAISNLKLYKSLSK